VITKCGECGHLLLATQTFMTLLLTDIISDEEIVLYYFSPSIYLHITAVMKCMNWNSLTRVGSVSTNRYDIFCDRQLCQSFRTRCPPQQWSEANQWWENCSVPLHSDHLSS